jgi:hypothetical protein
MLPLWPRLRALLGVASILASEPRGHTLPRLVLEPFNRRRTQVAGSHSSTNSAWQSAQMNMRPLMYTQLAASASQRRQRSGRLKGLVISGPGGAMSCMSPA